MSDNLELVAEVRNKVGNLIYSRNPQGAYTRPFKVPFNPQTVDQSSVRGRIFTLSKLWGSGTETFRAKWIQFARSFPNTDIFGDSVPLTGYNLFIKLNMNLLTIGATILVAPPLLDKAFHFNSLVLVALDTPGPKRWTITFSPAIPATHKIIVYATSPLNSNINFVHNEFRIIKVLDSTNGSPFALRTEYEAKFGALPLEGEKSFVKLVAIRLSSGQRGVERKTSAITA